MRKQEFYTEARRANARNGWEADISETVVRGSWWPLAGWRLSDFTVQDWTSVELINEGRQSKQMRFVPSSAYRMD